MTPSLNQTELLTLVAMARLGDEAYGVTISTEINDCTRRRVSLAAVYAALDRLERQGLVKAWLSEPLPERGGRARRHYALTAGGRALVRRERASALRMWRGVSLEPGSGRR
jgi:PadR family transcriptional regulator, regulatory protein PadR